MALVESGSGGASIPAAVTSLPGSPSNGQLALLTDSTTAPTYQWLCQYDSNISGSHKWRFLGGAPLYQRIPASGDAGETTTSATYADLATVGPSVTLPVVGLYRVDLTLYMTFSAAQSGGAGFTANGSVPADDSESAFCGVGAANQSGQFGYYGEHDFTNISTSAVVKMVYRVGGGITLTCYRRRLFVTPVLLG